MSIANKLIDINNAKQDIKQAISNKGVDMTGVPFTRYAEKIDEIQVGGDGDGEWSPNPVWNWWDIEQIVRDDIQGTYQYKVIELISDSFPETDLTGAQAYKTSDGAFYEGNATHIWNVAEDRQAYDDDGNATYKTRYIIRYYTSENINLTLATECLYFVVDKAKFSNSGLGTSTPANAKKNLLSFKLINGANLQLGVTDINSMFYNCYSLTSIPLFDTSNVTNMGSMFYNCHSLTSIPLFDTSNVRDMSSMFRSCYSLKSVPLFDTSNVTDMSCMFWSCDSFTSIPLFDTSNITDMSYMFYSCNSLTSVPLFDTSNITDMSCMFYSCYSLTSVPLFDTSNVTNMSYMFQYCYSLKSVPLFDTSNVTDMSYMFNGSDSFTSIPLFDTSNVTSMSYMFNGCDSLVSLKLQNLRTNLTLATTSYGLNINRDSLLYIIRNRSGTNAITLKIGATNLAKLTTEEIAEATNLYNITLA
jgi:surface protein